MPDASSFQPLFDRLLIEDVEPESLTKGGLAIPDNAKERTTRGRVITVGTGTVDKYGNVRKSSLAPGDQIQFRYYAGTPIEIDEKPYRMIREGDVLLVEEPA